MCVLDWWTVSALTRGLFWCLFPELRSNEGNKHQNNAQVSTETVRHESTYIILFLTRHNESINDYRYTSSPISLARFRSFHWWRHNRLPMTCKWLDNCDAITWIVINFIHGDNHGRSCTKNYLCTVKSLPYIDDQVSLNLFCWHLLKCKIPQGKSQNID